MVNGSQTVSSVGGGAPLYARASPTAAVLSAESTGTVEAATNLPADQVVAEAGPALRYNSFEFSYRQDFGKIVLLRQRPDTGEVVQQFPSEYYLRKYADGERVAKSAAVSGGGAEPVAKANVAREAVASNAVVVTPQASGAGNTPAAPVAIDAAPVAPSAPALPSLSASAGTNPVNLTI